MPPMRNSERALTERQHTTHSACPATTAVAAAPTTACEVLPPPNWSLKKCRSGTPSDSATMDAGAESPTRWQATPSMSATVRPASASAAVMARNASVSVLTPESLE